MKNIFTVDLEDWYHGNLEADEKNNNLEIADERIVGLTHLILRLLEDTDNTATFFILGEVAERHPELIRLILREGHEIASHGYRHAFV